MSEPNKSIVIDDADGWTTGSECDVGEPNELTLNDTQDGPAKDTKSDDEEEQNPGGDRLWDYLLLGIVLLLFLAHALHKDRFHYFVQSIKKDLVRRPPPLRKFAWPFYNGLLWITSVLFYRLLRWRANVLEWERRHWQRQRRLKKLQQMERALMQDLRKLGFD